MKIYIFQGVGQVSRSYHSGGGLAIVAADRPSAEKMVKDYNEKHRHDKDDYRPDSNKGDDTIVVTAEDWNRVTIYGLTGDPSPSIFVFPDAGCC